MLKFYSADISCENKEEPVYKLEATFENVYTLREAISLIKDIIENDPAPAAIRIEDDKTHQYFDAKYKFSNDLSFPVSAADRVVEEIFDIMDDGGDVFYIKLTNKEVMDGGHED